MRIISEPEVSEVLPSPACIPVMREALINVEEGTTTQYLRTAIQMRENKTFAFMPSYYNDKYFGAKIISVFPGNAGTDYPSHSGQVILFGSEHGEVLSMVDGTAITRIRTGAVSAVATDALARPDATTIAFIGAGTQAGSHYSAIKYVRSIDTVYIYDLNRAVAEQFADDIILESNREGFAAPEVIVCDSAQDAAADADIICTLTHSSTPLIDAHDVKPGAHINAVGACKASDRELGSNLVKNAKFYGDSKDSVFAESGDFLYPLNEGLISEDHYKGNLAAVLLEDIPGRESDDEITVFEALGLAAEDIASAIYCYEQLEGIDAVGEHWEDFVPGADDAFIDEDLGLDFSHEQVSAEITSAITADTIAVSEEDAAPSDWNSLMSEMQDVPEEAIEATIADYERTLMEEARADILLAEHTQEDAHDDKESADAVSPAMDKELRLKELEAKIDSLQPLMVEAMEHRDAAIATFNSTMEELKAVSIQITDLNIENGLLQNKLFGKKAAKAKLNENLAVLEGLTVQMEDCKERKEVAEIEQRRHQKNYDSILDQLNDIEAEIKTLLR